ncbi:hypothetical protein D3C85_1574360 [compost metagenome]
MRKRSERTSRNGHTAPKTTANTSGSAGLTAPLNWTTMASTSTMARPLRIAPGLPW